MSLVQAPDDQWPKAWLMRSNVTEPCSENKMDLDEPVLAADLKRIGISYWHMKDTEKFEYPIKAVPWDPNDAMDPELEQLRSDRGYSYADIITIHPNHLPDFETKIASFFEEHIHDAEEIRYILGGSGFFDVRDGRDNWVRIHVKRGDLITLPEGMYHRFTCDQGRMCHAMRLFKGNPVWTPFNRPQDGHASRMKYVTQFLKGNKDEQQFGG